MADEAVMRIGELAQRAGLTPRTIRYYEQLGLLGSIERMDSGYRCYSEISLARLHKIDALKELGLTLEEIQSVIDLYFEDETGVKGKQKVLEILQQHLAETDQRIQHLAKFRTELLTKIQTMERLIKEYQK